MNDTPTPAAAPSSSKPGIWRRIFTLPFCLILMPLPAAMWVGLNHMSMALDESILIGLRQSAFVLAGYVLLALVMRSITKAAVLVLPLALVWFSFDRLVSDPSVLQVALYLIAAVVVGVLLTRWKWRGEVLFFANVLTLAWMLQPTAATALLYSDSEPPQRREAALAGTARADSLPHIVHIVMDGYPNRQILREVHGLDNTAFEAALGEIGFTVLPNARANYGQTLQAIPAIFEMRTVEPLMQQVAERLGKPPEKLGGRLVRTMLSRRMEDSPVIGTLRASGYRIIVGESTYPRAIPGAADETWGPPKGVCEFTTYEYSIFRKTPFVFLCEQLHGRNLVYSRHYALLRTYAEIPDVDAWKQPTYFYTHILAPHAPFVIAPDGSYIPADPRYELADGPSLGPHRLRLYEDGLGRHMQWLNQALYDKIQKLIRSSRRPLVILMHGDHGTGKFWSSNQAQACIRERFAPFVAVYSTDGKLGSSLPADADLTMLFQAVFASQLGMQVALKPSPSYFTSWPAPGRQVLLDEAAFQVPCSGTASSLSAHSH